jgi:hypothetical protein
MIKLKHKLSLPATSSKLYLKKYWMILQQKQTAGSRYWFSFFLFLRDLLSLALLDLIS